MPKIKRHRPMSEINVVPYIDVMLVLLIIFMITAPLLTQGVKVDLPKATAKAIAAKETEPTIVSIDAAGNYYINIAKNSEQPVTESQMQNLVADKIREADARNENYQVFVKGDRRVDYGKVVAAMVLLQQAGVKNVGLMTEQPQKSVT